MEDIKQAGANLLVQLIEFHALFVGKVRIVELIDREAYAICGKMEGIQSRYVDIELLAHYLQLVVSPSPEPASASYSS